jgi:hypothetical protein
MSADRLKNAFRDSQSTDPMIRYRCLYRGKVMAQSDGTVDVRPFDPILPDMAGIPLRHGVPGLSVTVSPGCTIQIGWDDGRPDRPFAALWSTDASAVKVTLAATTLELGAAGATEAAVLGTNLTNQLASLATSIGSAMTSLGQYQAAGDCASFAGAVSGALSGKVRVAR